ncbi:DNA -binding domain-containing protein [Nioella sp.]|uniref:DNA -binding domain-containing protein n=1 Tax=Nioella sp. TaxID=1912091 RepID=UPI003A8A93C2
MSATGTTPISDLAPQGDDLTDYDHAHMTLYLRLFDAAESGASLQEISQILFGIDADKEPERARKIYDSHLARARWMTEHGYRKLLEGGTG